jgi:hypothetical protein
MAPPSGQHAVNRAGVLFRGLDRGRRPSGGPLIGDDLLQALDAVPGEGGYTVLTDPIDPQTAISSPCGRPPFGAAAPNSKPRRGWP